MSRATPSGHPARAVCSKSGPIVTYDRPGTMLADLAAECSCSGRRSRLPHQGCSQTQSAEL
eukprot:170286-Chlamydomonas_euryale.AAC.1